MTTATVLDFMHKTAEDEALRQQLEALLGVGDGNISSEADLDAAESAALTGDRAPIVAEFAAQNGFAFAVEDLVAVVDAFQRHQAGSLSDAEFASLLGIASAATPAETDLKVKTQVQRLTSFLKKTYLGIHS